ncbi:MAG: 3-carboxy-cis,cis-muconate cycloisomerase [Phyllobacterium sp.]
MRISAFDHPFLSGLFGDEEAVRLFTAGADIHTMLAFEAALAKAEAGEGIIPPDAAEAVAAACRVFEPDLAALKTATADDGVVIPELIRQLRKAVGKPYDAHVHYGATSQDAIDTSLILRLKQLSALLFERLDALVMAFDRLDETFGAKRLMGRTRMQAAIPITVSGRISAWRDPLIRHRARIANAAETLLVLQFGGAAGTLEKLGDKAEAVRAALARELGLPDVPQWHSQRDRLAEFANILALITGSLGKFGQDVALLAQAGDEISLSGGGGSSAMPHKQNPVAAEVLVTLARFNATQLAGFHQSMVHEQERSGAAWSLEWMLLPQMAVATASSLRLAQRAADNITSLGR